MEYVSLFISTWLKFLFLLTPFFVLSMFLSVTNGWEQTGKIKLAMKITLAALAVSFVLLFFGNWLFAMFGITVDAFRIGGGALLFLSALNLVNGSAAKVSQPGTDTNDIAVVPMAIPVTVGPGTTAALLVMGSETQTLHEKICTSAALLTAIWCLGGFLFFASQIERLAGKHGIAVLSKLTGLILAALASQMIFTGMRNLLFGP